MKQWQISFSFAIVNHTHAEPGNTFHESLTTQVGIIGLFLPGQVWRSVHDFPERPTSLSSESRLGAIFGMAVGCQTTPTTHADN